MSYEVLARKWRPQQFDDVIGQGHVTQTLRNAILSGRIAQAYLFVGPRGVGKTSIARIMAKALNCQSGKPPNPCDECDSCKEIKEGRNLDVIEIDGASNTGVDHIRELRDNVAYAPARGPYKIYIIDEVHMLSAGAFNALLKTLEEPPPHVKFFFATTEVQKIPATILSRCQRFDLRRIATRDISSHLGKLAKEEKISIDDDALLAIARGAEGGLRDAESALDQLIAFCGKKIQESDVLAVFGLASRKALDDLARAILGGDTRTILALVAEMDEAGKDLQRLNAELLDFFRNVLVLSATNEPSLLDVPEARLQSVKEVAGTADSARVLPLVDELVNLQSQMRYALSRRTLLEVALLRCARAARAVSIDEVIRLVSQAKTYAGAPAAPSAPTMPFRETPGTFSSSAPASKPPPAPAAQEKRNLPPAGNELAQLTNDWRNIVEQIGQYASLAKGYLLDARPIEVTAENVRIGFDPEFAGNREKVEIPRTSAAIQKVLSKVLNRQVSISFSVMAGRPAASGLSEKPKPSAKVSKSKREWAEDPAVKRALETFNGDIVDIRE